MTADGARHALARVGLKVLGLALWKRHAAFARPAHDRRRQGMLAAALQARGQR